MKELSHTPKQVQVLIMPGRQRYHWSETQEKGTGYMDTETVGAPVRWLTVWTNIHKPVSNEFNHHEKPLYINYATYKTIKYLSVHK